MTHMTVEESTRSADRAPHPLPEERCRLARLDEIPLGARRFAAWIQAVGWWTQVTYSRGTTVAVKTMEPGAVVHSVAVRVRDVHPRKGAAYGACAVWERKAGDPQAKWVMVYAMRWDITDEGKVRNPTVCTQGQLRDWVSALTRDQAQQALDQIAA